MNKSKARFDFKVIFSYCDMIFSVLYLKERMEFGDEQ
jgi:hypothetical protein